MATRSGFLRFPSTRARRTAGGEASVTGNRRFRIAVMPGDGIGPEMMGAALAVLDATVGADGTEAVTRAVVDALGGPTADSQAGVAPTPPQGHGPDGRPGPDHG